MRKKATASARAGPRRYRPPNVPLAAIRRFARRIAERFQPERIILFGSFAYGTPHADSDVDLLVVMPARNEIDQAVRIRLALEAPFPMDLIVRKPVRFERRVEDEDWFLTEISDKGLVLYEKAGEKLGSKGGRRLVRREPLG